MKKNVIKKYYSPKKGGWIRETNEVPMAKEDFFGKVVAYGKSKGVEVFPLWNSLGHNTLIPRMYPETAPIVDGKRSRVGFCVSSHKTYELLFNIYDTIIDKYLTPNGVKSFHIGLDEVRMEYAIDPENLFKVYSPWCECDGCKKLSNRDKMITHALKIIKHLKSRGMKNIYMYNDLLSRIFKEPEVFKSALVKENLLDITVIDWWTYYDIKELLSVKTTHPELGVRSTVKPWNSYYHWNVMRDSVWNVYHLATMANEEGCEGLQSYSAWDKTCDINHTAMADYSWNYKATGSVQEYRNRYALRNFPSQSSKAEKAFNIFAKVTEQGPALPTAENKDIGFGEFVKEHLAYYMFSYVRDNKDYPRNFPGESMQVILSQREILEIKLKELSHLANEAYKLFEELRGDVTGNTKLARRYAAEMRNYRDIADDYLALLAIHDICTKENENGKTDRIAEIAKNRKLVRLSLLEEMEEFKEEHLHASHLRNQSIYMQLFADIEDYASNTADADFMLDVCDMRPIASKAFYDLR